MAIVECWDRVVVANARAGSGKTTMAQGYADARKDGNILYLVFGKANQRVAKERFGSHVDCRTGHSLAFEKVGFKFAARNTFFLSPQDFARQIGLNDPKKAAVLLDVIGQFCVSDSAVINDDHLVEPMVKWGLAPNELDEIKALASLAWRNICKPNSEIGVLPDFYLKMWALTKPKLSEYTHIILDEAQDTNPVLAKVVEEQSHAFRLLVGDQHQSIYQFRGALNAMESFSAMGATVMSMPTTWRFGPEIADKANKLLRLFKGEQVPIIGAGPSAPRRPEDKRAVLSRTNAGLIAEAAAVFGRDTHWVGGIKDYKTEVLVDAFYLSINQRSAIRDPKLRKFQSWTQYIHEAENMRDGGALLLIKLVDRYRKDIPAMVQAFHSNALPTEAGAKLVLSTMHKAKGLDFDHVTLGEDFHGLDKAMSSLLALPLEALEKKHVQEINGLYVGISRARHQLDLNKESRDFFANYERHVSAYQEAYSRAQLDQEAGEREGMTQHQSP